VPDFSLEQTFSPFARARVVGLDEAGRGPWAGPVVAAAAWLDPDTVPCDLLARLDDSKKLTRRTREALYQELAALATVAVGEASVVEIDEINILAASLLAMQRAVAALPFRPDVALVDGNRLPNLPCRSHALVKGDSRSLSIAAASIVAKVTRDCYMAKLAESHPGYGWERNQGYGTQEHRDGLDRLGITPHHRRSFRPIHERLSLSA